jgi:hypothetical protein
MPRPARGRSRDRRCVHPTDDPRWLELLRDQDAAFGRAQAADFGVTDSMIRAQVDAGRWQRPHRGVVVAHNGALTFRTRAWAAVLACGSPAVVSHRAAGHLAGLFDQPPGVIDVSVPAERRPAGVAGVRVHRRRGELLAVGSPPRTPIEQVVLDLVQVASAPDEVIALLTAAIERRLSTPARLRVAASRCPKLAWRALVDDVLVTYGVHSPLEWRFLRDVERRHRLPRSDRQVRETTGGALSTGALATGAAVWRDVVYARFGVVVELDGAAAHPRESRHKDMARDNAVVVAGGRPLRYGWRDVVGRACVTAAQLAGVLRVAGWAGAPRACGPGCALPGLLGSGR